MLKVLTIALRRLRGRFGGRSQRRAPVVAGKRRRRKKRRR